MRTHSRPAFIALAIALTSFPMATRAQAPTVLTPMAQVKHSEIPEMSGIVKSRRYPNTYWVQNDSGDVARIFAIRSDGTTIMPSWLAGDYYVDTPVAGKKPYPGIAISLAANYDWEDIAIDGDTLYIPDMGNNGNARRDLGVYVVPEPNPEGVEATRPLKWLPVAYPGQTAFPPAEWRFDSEAMFVAKHKLYFLAKWRDGNKMSKPGVGTALYRLDSQHTDRVNVLKKLDTRQDLGGWVTAADVSPDGRTLAILCQAPTQSVWLFDISLGNDHFLSRPARRLVFTGGKQCEAICFDDNETLLIGNEQRDLYRVSVSQFPPANK